jgi:hypothetical protein
MNKQDIAKICHDVLASYCRSQNDFSQVPWEEAPDWQKESALLGVKLHLEDPTATAATSHESWMRQKLEDGWLYGPIKDAEAKTHPCLIPFADLPLNQQAKDYLFRAVVHALAPFLTEN